MKYQNKILGCILMGLLTYGSVSANEISSVDVQDQNTLSVTLAEDVITGKDDIVAEMTLLNDTALREVVVDEANPKKVEIMLEDTLLPKTNYSILTVVGAEGSIDIATPDSVDGFIYKNPQPVDGQGITDVEVINDHRIVLTYAQDIESANLEYKVLAESAITSITRPDADTPSFELAVEPPLESNKDYILMVIDLQDIAGNYVDFETGIFDFTTPTFDTIEALTGTGVVTENAMAADAAGTGVTLEDAMTTGSGELVEDSSADELTTAQLLEESLVSGTGATTLDAAPEEDDSMNNVEEVAMTAVETPDTGAETWVLVFATLIINSFYYFARRKNAQHA